MWGGAQWGMKQNHISQRSLELCEKQRIEEKATKAGSAGFKDKNAHGDRELTSR